MIGLEDILAARIRTVGPLNLAEYMTDCLLHPTHGYYTTRDPLGAAGDFTTAPEISQMFGELLGLALAQAWLDRGAPSRIRLAELGPGRGTLMADVLRATSGIPSFHDAITLHLIEASPILRDCQRKSIAHPLTHHDRAEDIPADAPLFLIANEFFDALPIRQFQRSGAAWRERVVGLNDTGLCLGLADPTRPEPLDHRLSDTQDGEIVEQCPLGQTIAASLSERIAETGGMALIVDYGGWRSLGDTLQAVRDHQPVAILDRPGTADLTAHVDFEALARAATAAEFTELTPQGVFLDRLGIAARTQALARNLSGAALDSHRAAYHRLTAEGEMGTLFKVMAFYQKDTPLPPGFAA